MPCQRAQASQKKYGRSYTATIIPVVKDVEQLSQWRRLFAHGGGASLGIGVWLSCLTFDSERGGLNRVEEPDGGADWDGPELGFYRTGVVYEADFLHRRRRRRLDSHLVPWCYSADGQVFRG